MQKFTFKAASSRRQEASKSCFDPRDSFDNLTMNGNDILQLIFLRKRFFAAFVLFKQNWTFLGLNNSQKKCITKRYSYAEKKISVNVCSRLLLENRDFSWTLDYFKKLLSLSFCSRNLTFYAAILNEFNPSSTFCLPLFVPVARSYKALFTYNFFPVVFYECATSRAQIGF